MFSGGQNQFSYTFGYENDTLSGMKNGNWYESIPDPERSKPRLVSMTPEERLAHEIRSWRRTGGMSQACLAGKAGTTQRVISLLEAGKYNPTLELLERLAGAMNLRLEVAFRRQPR